MTIKAGAGDDQISLKASGNSIYYSANGGNDTIYGFNESDTLHISGGKYSTQKSGDDIIVNVGTGSILLKDAAGKKLSINEYRTTKLITLTKSGDEFKNKLINVAIQGLGGHDSIINEIWSDCVTINGDAGNDLLYTYESDRVTLLGGAGNDSLFNGNNFIDELFLNNGGKQVFMDGGKGNDKIGNNSDHSVTVNGGAGDDYIFTFSGEKISINAGAGPDLFIYFAEGDEDVKVSNDIITDYEEEDTIQFDELSDSTVSSITTNESGSVIFKVSKNKLVVKNAADKVVTYIDSDGTIKTFGGSSADEWKLDGTTATYGSLTVKGVTFLDGLKLSGKVITVSAASLGTEKISVSDGYTLKLGSDVSSASTKKSWTLKNSTATYKQTTTAGYSLVDNEIIYSKKSSKTLATVKLAGDALSKKVTVSGAYTFDFASDYKNATITGSSLDDTIIARGKNIFVTGGDGSDVFALKSTGTISDYEEADKISLTGSANISTDGNDLIFNGKVTVTGGAKKSVTYIDADGQHTIKPATKNFILSADGKSITLTDTYLDDDFNVADFGAAIQTIDASAVVHELNLTGNKLANVIIATAKDDYVDGGAGSDTLLSGKGSDVFVYKAGDGSIIIEDFDDSWDKIRVLSGDVNSPTVDKAGDVTFAVDDGQIVIKGGASKYIPIYDEGKNILMKHTPR